MQTSGKINNITKKVTFVYDDGREMEFGSLEGRVDKEHCGVNLEEIAELLVMLDIFYIFWGATT